MISNGTIRFLLIFLLAGVLGGAIFGFVLAMCIFGLIYSPESLILFALIVSFIYIFVIFLKIIKKNYLALITKPFEILFFSSLINAMFLLEEEIIEFNSFDWIVIYISVALAISVMTTFVILEEYFQDSWLYKEINHIITGMQIYGLIPKDKKKEE